MNNPTPSGIPGYKVLHELGRGGMATVYRAVQESLGREVALKVMSPDMARDPAFAERFLREGKVVARLRHKHIVTVHDLGVANNGAPYIAMEFVPGGSVAQRIGQLNVATALRCVKEIASALDAAHRNGIIHRDVKPENILCHEDGSFLLSDFGVARLTESTAALTAEGSTLGTPQYMSPEQWRGEQLDGRSDLYSLGVVLYQLLTGKVPYSGTDGWAIGMQHMSATVPQLPALAQPLQPLLNAMLAKSRDERPADGAAVNKMIDDLLPALPRQAPLAPPPMATVATPTPPPVMAAAPPPPPPPQAHPQPQPAYAAQPAVAGQQVAAQPRKSNTGTILAVLGGVLLLVLGLAGWFGYVVYKKVQEAAAEVEAGVEELADTSGDETSGDDSSGDSDLSGDSSGDTGTNDETAVAEGDSDKGTETTDLRADGNIQEQLDRIGMDYTIDEDGDFRMEIPTTGGRTQLVFVRSPVETYEAVSVREIWSYGYQNEDGGDALPIRIAHQLLEDNNDVKIGGWSRQGQRGLFIIKIDTDASDAELKDAIDFAATHVDKVEETLSGDDDAF